MTEPRKVATGQLGRNALARLPLTMEEVERIYATPTCLRDVTNTKHLCESHERLRAENIGQELLLADAEKRIAELESLRGELAAADGRVYVMEGVLREIAAIFDVGVPIDMAKKALRDTAQEE